MCVCVCVYLSRLRPNGQTYRPEFWHVGQVEGYLGQGHRSRPPGKKKVSMRYSSNQEATDADEAWLSACGITVYVEFNFI